jgi:hypothetical protein
VYCGNENSIELYTMVKKRGFVEKKGEICNRNYVLARDNALANGIDVSGFPKNLMRYLN